MSPNTEPRPRLQAHQTRAPRAKRPLHLDVKRPTCATGRPDAVALSGEGARRRRKLACPQSPACASSAGRSTRRAHFSAYQAGEKPVWLSFRGVPQARDDEESRSGWAHRWPPVRARFLAEFTLSGQSEILRCAQDDSEGLGMTLGRCCAQDNSEGLGMTVWKDSSAAWYALSPWLWSPGPSVLNQKFVE